MSNHVGHETTNTGIYVVVFGNHGINAAVTILVVTLAPTALTFV
jgi:hypothetical protein